MDGETRFDGVFTALVTPFGSSGAVDWKIFDALLDRQLAAGVAGVVPVGTTGEAATLETDEAQALIERTVKRVDGRAYVLAGAGSNATAKAVSATKRAADAGADGVLLVTPYYNKPTQEGLIAHFGAIAESAPVDNMLYSVPGRTGIAIEPGTFAALGQVHKNIVAIKEAGGDPARVTALRRAGGGKLVVHCGDDGLALPFYALGARGLTSVLSNYDPEICVALYRAWTEIDTARACALHDLTAPLVEALFIESSPAPVKRAMAMSGLIDDRLRLPLVGLKSSSQHHLGDALKTYGHRREELINHD